LKNSKIHNFGKLKNIKFLKFKNFKTSVMNGNERQKRNVELSIATCKLTEPGRLE